MYYLKKVCEVSRLSRLHLNNYVVKNPQEATLDSHLLLSMSNNTAAKARAMKSGQGAFDIDDFVSKLITFMGGRKSLDEQLPDDSDTEEVDDGDAPLDWEKIARKALAKSRRAPVMDFMRVTLHLFTLTYKLNFF